jgi:hypothetical protein
MDGETLDIQYNKDDDMEKVIEEFEKKHGKLNINMFCQTEQDMSVWDSIPLTDTQKKMIIINILQDA